MEKDFFDRTAEAAQELPEKVSKEILRKKFRELVNIISVATVEVVKNRNDFRSVLLGYQRSIMASDPVVSMEQWDASIQVYVFIYTTLRDVAYGRRDRLLLTTLYQVFQEELALLNQGYLNSTDPTNRGGIQQRIDQRMVDIRQMQEVSLVALKRLQSPKSRLIKGRED